MGEAGKDLDIAAYMTDEVLPQIQECLDENMAQE
jgi:hypothetical protein